VKYSVDTSAILNAWRQHYPPDLFQPLWQKVGDLVEGGKLIATEEVFVELGKKDDEVYSWARQHRYMFVPLDEEIQRAVSAILRSHPRLLDNRNNRSGADPFVIALARIAGCTVVTYETPSNSSSRPRIPDVCSAMNIRWINVLQMLREQGWRI
jgi:hypothetical protein